MVDARWYLILKEFEYASTIEPGADLALRKNKSPNDPNAPSGVKVGLALTAFLLVAILISSLSVV